MGRLKGWQVMERCNNNGIRVFHKPLTTGKKADTVLVVEIQGWRKEGENVYKQNYNDQIEANKKIDELYWKLYFDYRHKFKKNCTYDFINNCYISNN